MTNKEKEEIILLNEYLGNDTEFPLDLDEKDLLPDSIPHQYHNKTSVWFDMALFKKKGPLRASWELPSLHDFDSDEVDLKVKGKLLNFLLENFRKDALKKAKKEFEANSIAEYNKKIQLFLNGQLKKIRSKK